MFKKGDNRTPIAPVPEVYAPCLLPLDQLRNTREFAECTDAQRLWIATYIEAKLVMEELEARLVATRTAYKCKNDLVAKIHSYNVMRHPNVKNCIGRHEGKTEKEVFLERVRAIVNSDRPNALRLKALELEARVRGWDIEQIENLKTWGARRRAVVKRNARHDKRLKANRVAKPEAPAYAFEQLEKTD